MNDAVINDLVRQSEKVYVVATIPKKTKYLRRLIKYHENLVEQYNEIRQGILEHLASKGVMFDRELIADLVMVMYDVDKKDTEERLRQLKTALMLRRKPKEGVLRNPDTITDIDIEKARAFPIKSLVKVRMNTTTCLWHNDRHPSMHVYPDNHAYCFVCQKRADSIDFAMQMTGKIFVEAVKHLI